MKEGILFDLEVLIGNWESVNLHPTIIVYRNDNRYLLSIIYISETTQQAQPATYEILTDEKGYYIFYDFKRVEVDYRAKEDLLFISTMGEYLHN